MILEYTKNGLSINDVRGLTLHYGTIDNLKQVHRSIANLRGIYIDQKAPEELKTQAQGFIFFVTFGCKSIY